MCYAAVMGQHTLWIPEMKAAYVACAIDTDGWITIQFHKRVDDGSVRFYANIGVCSQSLLFLNQLSDFTGLPPRIGTNSRIGKDNRAIVTRQVCYQILWRSPLHVVPLLEQVLPYLLIKRRQGELVLEFARSRLSAKGLVNRSGAPYTARTVEIAYSVRSLNRMPLILPTDFKLSS